MKDIFFAAHTLCRVILVAYLCGESSLFASNLSKAESEHNESLSKIESHSRKSKDPINSLYAKDDFNWEKIESSAIDSIFQSADSHPESQVTVEEPVESPIPTLQTNVQKQKTTPSPAARQALHESRTFPKESFKNLIEKTAPKNTQAKAQSKHLRSFVSRGSLKHLEEEDLTAQIEENRNAPEESQEQSILINFNNVSIIEYIRFISRVSNRNFIFSDEDLQFTVTIISEEPTSLENVLMALMQELRIRNLDIVEEGNTLIIHPNASYRAPGKIVSDGRTKDLKDADIITRVFRLNTAAVDSISTIIRPMLSDKAIVQPIQETNHLVVTDILSNIQKISDLIRSVDAPNSSLVVGQYVVRNAFIDDLIRSAEQILTSIARGQPITFVPHAPSNSIFIISTPFLVERAIPVLQRLDQNDGTTGIYDLNELKYVPQKEVHRPFTEEEPEELPEGGVYKTPQVKGKWELDSNGNWFYSPFDRTGRDQERPPSGSWKSDPNGNWEYEPGRVTRGVDTGAPEGHWELGPDGKWRFVLNPGSSIFSGKKVRAATVETLPLGHIERTRFYIHKLQFRKGDSVEQAIARIGQSLSDTTAINQDLLSAINSVQWLEPSNSLVFTGTPEALLKIKELVDEIDSPLRQVFIEMLIMELDIDDSLELGVNWGSRFAGGDVAGAQGFLTGASPIPGLLRTAGTNLLGAAVVDELGVALPDAITALTDSGYRFGIIGQTISVGGREFASLSAFVKALHQKFDSNVIMNPKIITEDNVTAEIFVGINTRFRTQSISNDQGSILTSNFEFRDVGTLLRVTPFLGNSNIITLEIEQEVSSIAPDSTDTGNALSDASAGPTTRINKTKTRVHVPDGFFIVLSGMINDETRRFRDHVPCLGGAPLIGALFTEKRYLDQKRNLMIFIRPQLIDTEEQIDNLTRHQQNIYRVKGRTKNLWKLDCQETLDWLNLIDSDSLKDEKECCSGYDYYERYHKDHCH